MNSLLPALLASVVGGVIGAALVSFAKPDPIPVEAAVPRKLIVRELSVVTENGRLAAQLKAEDDRAFLTIYTPDGKPGLEAGVEGRPAIRYLRFQNDRGEIVSGITSFPPDGNTTIGLGDNERGPRVIVGALGSADIPSYAPVKVWGIELRSVVSQRPLFSAVVNSIDASRPRASVQLRRPDGTYWTVQ